MRANKRIAVVANEQYSAAYNSLTLGNIAEGDLLWIDTNGDTIETGDLSTAERAQLVFGAPEADGRRNFVPLTPMMERGELIEWTETACSNPVDQVWHLGWDGTSGDLTVADDTTYGVSLVQRVKRSTYHNYDPTPSFYVKSAASGAAKQDVAWELLKASILPGLDFFKVEMVGEVTDQSSSIAANFDVVEGSATVTGTGAFANAVAGDFLAVQDASYDAAQVYLYKIKEVPDNNTAILDSPYQGPSGTIDFDGEASFNAGTGDKGGLVQAFTSVGLKFTAVQPPFDINGHYERTKMELYPTYGWAGDMSLAKETTADDPGSGSYREVALDEYRMKRNIGQHNYTEFPVTDVMSRATPGEKYTAFDLKVRLKSLSMGHVDQNMVKPITIWVPESTTSGHIDVLLNTHLTNFSS